MQVPFGAEGVRIGNECIAMEIPPCKRTQERVTHTRTAPDVTDSEADDGFFQCPSFMRGVLRSGNRCILGARCHEYEDLWGPRGCGTGAQRAC